MKKILITILLLLPVPVSAEILFVDKFDFLIRFESCKIAAGYLVLSDESLKILDGIPTMMGCKKELNKMLCHYTFDDKNFENAEYQIVLNTKPLLHFSDQAGAEYIAINTDKHAATIVSRILTQDLAAAKVCQGTYATIEEINKLQK